ncbi:MAG: hypothetical protein QM680_01925 [Luteolibacter sp.]
MWSPYSKRFANNAVALRKLGIPTVEIIVAGKLISPKRDVVCYRKLEGETLRNLEKTEARMVAVAGFFAELHRKGVFFRSAHFGNILELPDGRLGIIDMVDLTCKGRPLSLKERVRNFRHLTKYKEDRAALEDFGMGKFVEIYLNGSGLGKQGERLRKTFVKNGMIH